MLKARMHAKDGGPPRIMLGLQPENIERLQKGEPIQFKLSDVGLGEGDCIIFTGPDLETMATMIGVKLPEAGHA